MAGLKKNKRNKDTASPNLVLVLFLILFVISNIILGLWLYFVYDEKNKAVSDAVAKRKEKEAAETAMKVHQAVLDETRIAVGQKLNQDEMTLLNANLAEFLPDTGKLAKVEEKSREPYKKLIEMVRTDLKFDEATHEYGTTYKAMAEKAAKEAADSLASLKKAQKDLQAVQAEYKALEAQRQAYFTATDDKVAKNQQLVLKAANNQTDEMGKQVTKNKELIDDLQKADKARADLDRKYQLQVKKLEELLEEKSKERPDAAAARGGDPHALMLDISRGKPLWDDKVGSIKRVDVKSREVVISVGSAQGVKPDLTFNVFAPSRFMADRPEGPLKGTIEVIRVLGAQTSLARITSEFDPKFTINEGDLLFNMFWGTRVAVAGYVDVMGARSDSPREQASQLEDFMYLLSRQGIIVDAYVDLTDGQIKGAVTPNTRYLIRGLDLGVDKGAKEDDPTAQRVIAVNNGSLIMRKDAIDKGLFTISAPNFAAVIGYRPAGSGPKDDLAFRPSLPFAGSPAPGVNAGAAAPRPEQPAPEPKEKADPKEKAN